MQIKINGKLYDHDAERLLVSEALAIEELTGYTVRDWNARLAEEHPLAMKGLAWILMRRAGEDIAFADVDFDLGEWEVIDNIPPAEAVSQSPNGPELTA